MAGLGQFTRGAQLLKMLSNIPPGKAVDISADKLLDIEVPANPMDRQTPEYLIDWFYARLPFYCKLEPDVFKRKWTFYRPTQKELEDI